MLEWLHGGRIWKGPTGGREGRGRGTYLRCTAKFGPFSFAMIGNDILDPVGFSECGCLLPQRPPVEVEPILRIFDA